MVRFSFFTIIFSHAKSDRNPTALQTARISGCAKIISALGWNRHTAAARWPHLASGSQGLEPPHVLITVHGEIEPYLSWAADFTG